MIRMANLMCRQCGMSIDEDVNGLDAYCPNCGGKLYISVSQAIDIWNEKKEFKRKDVKYSTQVSALKDRKSKEKKTIDIWHICGLVTIAAVLLVFGLLVWFFVKGWCAIPPF